jgi:hypothetical protein
MPPAIVTPLPALAWCATQPRWLTATGDTLVWATGEADEPGGLFAIRAADLGRVAPRCLLDFAPWRDAGVVCPLGLAVHAGRACLIIADEIVQVPLDGNAPTTLRRPRDAAMLWSIGTWRDELHVATYETTQRELRSLSPVRWGIERVHDGRFERTHEAIQPGDRPVPRFDATDVPTPPWYLADATGVCFDDGDGHVVRIDAAAIPGRLPSGFWPHHAVAVDDGVVMTNHAGEVVHAGPAVGIRLWQLTDLDGDLLVADVLAVVAGCAVLRCERPGAWGEWRLCALPLTGGAVVELFRTPSQITSVAACAGRLFWALANGALGAVDLAGFPRPVPVSVPPNPWRATGAPTADTRPPAADAESPGGRALPAALRSACSAPPLPSDVAVPPWITWPLLALTRYRRQMLALVPHLPPVVTEVDAPLVGRRGVVTCYTWSAAVRARGAAYDQLVFRTLPTRPGCWTLDPTVVDAQAVARWIERRRGPIEERVWRWLPDVALLADLLPQWVEQAGGHTDDGWLQLGAPLEDLIRDEAGPLDDLRLEAFGPLAAALGDVEVHDAASPRCSAVAARHAAFIDGLVDAGRASVGGALPGLEPNHAGLTLREEFRGRRLARRDARHRREPAPPALQVPVGPAVRAPSPRHLHQGQVGGHGRGQDRHPVDKLILELLQHTPTMLLLDEFQTWYDGLTNTKQYPWKNWAFNFIQILSEIAKEHPDLLVLVISVRNGGSDAYQQVHRVNPVAIDFKAGGSAERIQQDRRRMLLHRLFDNRLQITKPRSPLLIAQHVAENPCACWTCATAEQERKRKEFTESRGPTRRTCCACSKNRC